MLCLSLSQRVIFEFESASYVKFESGSYVQSKFEFESVSYACV